MFDHLMREADALLDQAKHTSLFNLDALHEIRLRGLVATGRADIAIGLIDHSPAPTTTVAPQWHVIERVTVADVQLLAGDHSGAHRSLEIAIREAAPQRLPHQLQRIIRTAGYRLPEIYGVARQALNEIRQELAA